MRDPDEDLGGRSLLGVIAAGFIVVGLLLLVMSYFDSDGPEDAFVVPAWIVGLGLLGLVGAGVGRAFGRWLLAGFGVLLVGGAVDGVLESLSWASGPGRFEFVVFGSMVLFGVAALVVAFRSMWARRRDRRQLAGSAERL